MGRLRGGRAPRVRDASRQARLRVRPPAARRHHIPQPPVGQRSLPPRAEQVPAGGVDLRPRARLPRERAPDLAGRVHGRERGLSPDVGWVRARLHAAAAGQAELRRAGDGHLRGPARLRAPRRARRLRVWPALGSAAAVRGAVRAVRADARRRAREAPARVRGGRGGRRDACQRRLCRGVPRGDSPRPVHVPHPLRAEDRGRYR